MNQVKIMVMTKGGAKDTTMERMKDMRRVMKKATRKDITRDTKRDMKTATIKAIIMANPMDIGTDI